MRIACVYLLLDVETDGAAADFCSETFNGMPYVVDWARGDVPEKPSTQEYSKHYDQGTPYEEGDFLWAVKGREDHAG